jgi:hypothetical protein
MDFWVDIAFAVLFRLLKDETTRRKYLKALVKLRDELDGLPLGSKG